MKFTFASVAAAVFALQVAASAVPAPEAELVERAAEAIALPGGKHDDDDKHGPKVIIKTVTDYKYKYKTVTETETKYKYKFKPTTIYKKKLIFKTVTETETETKYKYKYKPTTIYKKKYITKTEYKKIPVWKTKTVYVKKDYKKGGHH